MKMLSLPQKVNELIKLIKIPWEHKDTSCYDGRVEKKLMLIPYQREGIYTHTVDILALTERGKGIHACDTFLGLTIKEDPEFGYDIRFQDGKFVSGVYYYDLAAIIEKDDGILAEFPNPQEFLQHLTKTVRLSTDEFLSYFAHPSLGAEMRQRIGGLFEVEERYNPTFAQLIERYIKIV